MTPTPTQAAPATPAAPKSAFGLGTIYTAVRRAPIVAGLILLVAIGAAAGVWILTPLPKMTGYVVFQMASNAPHILTQTERQDFGMFRQNQAILVKSQPVLAMVLKDPAVERSSLLAGQADKAGALDSLVKVDFRLGNEFMRVVVEGNDSAELQAVCDAIEKAYLEEVVLKKRNQQKARREKLMDLEGSLGKSITQTLKNANQWIQAQSTLNPEDVKRYAFVTEDLAASVSTFTTSSYSPGFQMNKASNICVNGTTSC